MKVDRVKQYKSALKARRESAAEPGHRVRKLGAQDLNNSICDDRRLRELDALKPDSVCISSQRVLKLYLVVLGVRTSLELSQYNLHLCYDLLFWRLFNNNSGLVTK